MRNYALLLYIRKNKVFEDEKPINHICGRNIIMDGVVRDIINLPNDSDITVGEHRRPLDYGFSLICPYYPICALNTYKRIKIMIKRMGQRF